MQKPSLPKGTRDFGPEIMQKRRFLLSTIEEVYQQFGFVPIETPAMEQLSTLNGKYGDEGDKLLFRVLNSGDFLKKVQFDEMGQADKMLPKISEKGLRYDLTVPFARFVVMHRNELSFPFRRYQMQAVWRADRPQKGRYREFWQCDADIIGTDSLTAEADLLGIYKSVFSKLNIEVKLMVNHRKLLEGVAEVIGIKDEFKQFTIILDKLDKLGWDGIQQELSLLGISGDQMSFLKKHLVERPFNSDSLQQLRMLLEESACALEALNELAQILEYKQASNNEQKVYLNPSLARGLDYYTGCIFEAVPIGVKMGSISGGGRYANLTELFGLPNMSGVGISFGIDRIYDVIEELERWPESASIGTQVLFCHFDEESLKYNLQLATDLRSHGISCELYPEPKKLGKQLDYANKKGIPFAVITGEKEMNEEVYTLKNLQSGEQYSLKKPELMTYWKV